ncbi:unnamed protein product [Mytilus edulis]|uniref:Uncharacterized protein n=1 Tax=Mytilus edulis TaxID=6550 RepID=A0A8S3UE34_MYTED|nr:unnamed protein product [Mytilus edulis]
MTKKMTLTLILRDKISYAKTIPSERDTDQNRRRQIVDQHNTYNNDIYNDKKYDQKQNQQDQQKDWSKRRNSSEVPEHRENNEIITIQEKKKTRQRKQVIEIKMNLIGKQQQLIKNAAIKNSGIKQPQGVLDTLVDELQDHDISNQIQKMNFNVGLRTAYRLQECQSSHFKQTFPDVDYAFFGYNILRGYPIADGHDPDFAFPIFKIDYSNGDQSGDCRFSVPHGLIVIPDVSCITSFSSTIVQKKYDYFQNLCLLQLVYQREVV